MRHIAKLILLLFMAAPASAQNPDYGLVSGEKHYPFSYYVDSSQLLVKSGYDYADQFETEDARAFCERIASFGGYSQPCLQYMPIMQRILEGDKFVLVFEGADILCTNDAVDTLVIVQRLAMELDTIKDTLVYPADFRGCYFRASLHEWLPIMYGLDSGVIIIEDYSEKFGRLSGHLSVRAIGDTSGVSPTEAVVYEYKRITGDFIVRDKDRQIMLNIPAREACGLDGR